MSDQAKILEIAVGIVAIAAERDAARREATVEELVSEGLRAELAALQQRHSTMRTALSFVRVPVEAEDIRVILDADVNARLAGPTPAGSLEPPPDTSWVTFEDRKGRLTHLDGSPAGSEKLSAKLRDEQR